jgi:sialic acid synthase SpsE
MEDFFYEPFYERFSEKNISTFRPDIGLSASFYPNIIGKKSLSNLKANDVLKKRNFK